jgi:hypothetical protein
MDEIEFGATVAAQEEYEMNTPQVYKAINAVQARLAKTGISKDRKNTQGNGYMFRGIDDVYNALSPLLAEHGLCIMPRILSRECVERQSQKGGALFYVTVEAEFDFVCAADGSRHVVRTFGEAMDSGDKATNKAMSAAYKYAAFQAFAIPTEGDNDADAQTHEVKAQAIPPQLLADARAAAMEGIEAYKAFYQALEAGQRRMLASEHESLKATAKQADEALA